jgi:hypothetical protein
MIIIYDQNNHNNDENHDNNNNYSYYNNNDDALDTVAVKTSRYSCSITSNQQIKKGRASGIMLDLEKLKQ